MAEKFPNPAYDWDRHFSVKARIERTDNVRRALAGDSQSGGEGREFIFEKFKEMIKGKTQSELISGVREQFRAAVACCDQFAELSARRAASVVYYLEKIIEELPEYSRQPGFRDEIAARMLAMQAAQRDLDNFRPVYGDENNPYHSTAALERSAFDLESSLQTCRDLLDMAGYGGRPPSARPGMFNGQGRKTAYEKMIAKMDLDGAGHLVDAAAQILTVLMTVETLPEHIRRGVGARHRVLEKTLSDLLASAASNLGQALDNQRQSYIGRETGVVVFHPPQPQ